MTVLLIHVRGFCATDLLQGHQQPSLTHLRWAADWYHPVISGSALSVRVQLPSDCGAAKHHLLPGRAYGVCRFHLPQIQSTRPGQVTFSSHHTYSSSKVGLRCLKVVSQVRNWLWCCCTEDWLSDMPV